jgi:lipoprotein-anchoring transpeptidase ErfK/SrfK
MARVRTALLAVAVSSAVLLGTAPAYAAAPPTTVTGLAATPKDRQVTLSWTNPADADFAGVTVVKKTGATPPSAVADGATVYAGTGRSVIATGLTNGTAYSFAVFTRNTAGDVSDPAVTTATPIPALVTSLAVTISPSPVTYGGQPLVRATLRRSDTHEVIPGATVDLYRKPYGTSSFVHVYRLTTNGAGVASHLTMPAAHTQWYAAHPADPSYAASTSPTVTSLVRAKLSVTRSRAVVEQGVASVVTAYVAPNHAGQKVLLQRYYDNAWHGVGEKSLSSSSAASFGVVTTVIGTRVYRVVKPADADHASAAWPSFGIVTVRRTLRSGMTGSDVKTVQSRLRYLHYDVGTENGAFGYDTLHATAAFQKVNGIPVTGEVDAATYAKLWKQTAPKLLHPQSGTWVEVDLTKQVLYYARDNVVLRVLDISSGSGKYFTVGGETQKAVTPTGSFRIFHKIDGMRTSRLGQLWRPAYFAAGGYAIHGNSSVPFHPASHGCVRITNSAMNRLFALLTIGMRVYVYRS